MLNERNIPQIAALLSIAERLRPYSNNSALKALHDEAVVLVEKAARPDPIPAEAKKFTQEIAALAPQQGAKDAERHPEPVRERRI